MQAKKTIVIVATLLAVVAGVNATNVVSPVSVTAESQLPSFNRMANYVIDGSGMSENPVTLSSTAFSDPDRGMWLNGGGHTNSWITFDLGPDFTDYALTGFHVWNYNEESQPGWNFKLRGAKDVEVYVGDTPLANGSSMASAGPNWGTLVKTFTSQNGNAFVQASGLDGDSGQDYFFDSAVTGHRYVQFYILNNYGDTSYVGLSEVRFEASNPVPEPVTLAAVGMGLAGLGGYIRRRRASAK